MADQKPRMGRPPLANPRSVVLSCRVTGTVWRQLQKRLKGEPVSAWLEGLVQRELRRKKR